LDDLAYRRLRFNGSITRGSEMFVFRENTPKLSIVEAAGTAIAVGAPGPVSVTLPFGAPTNQLVRIQSTGLTNATPVRVVVTPDSGPALAFEQVVAANIGSTPRTTVFDVVIPAGNLSQIDAWTR
jgi:hypothetical protein